MHGALAFDGPLSLDALRAAFDALVARHEPLRTRFDFDANADRPVQIIDPPQPAQVEIDEVSEAHLPAALARHAGRPFDLTQGPVFTVRVWRVTPIRHVMSCRCRCITSFQMDGR